MPGSCNKISRGSGYGGEPWADRKLSNYIIRAQEPFNAESRTEDLVQSFVTPTDSHFRRNHGPIPDIDGREWTMSIDVCTSAPAVPRTTQTLGLRDLEAHPQFEVTAVLECAGNRRDGLKAIKPVNGVTWGAGTASNAHWGGCRLRDVLAAAGVPTDLSDPFYSVARHVEFAAYGEASDDVHYASSIPVDWVMNPLNMVLVATAMNGKPLLRDHGFPARIVAPGIIGARWVKWLKGIRVQDQESACYYQQRDYKILPPMAGGSNCDEYWSRFPALMELSVQSAICRPARGECLQIGRPYVVRGYALTGGGRAVDRVEVSLDDGATWDLAELHTVQAAAAKHWAWVLWSYHMASVPPQCTVASRAWDSGGNVQPSAAVWNYRGVMNNSVFRISAQTTAGPAKI
ncbi:hypothetical protein GGF46_001359 [Coemansia sp. RSA 552]|nr:hypothetical protein GGF46_001359 [Coemansia sp. RSA 552]